jgi:hypothetical protein
MIRFLPMRAWRRGLELVWMDEGTLFAVLCGAPCVLVLILAAACGPGKVFTAMT